jgi:hypothetical protein
LKRQRGELSEQPNAHFYDMGGMRRPHAWARQVQWRPATRACGWARQRAVEPHAACRVAGSRTGSLFYSVGALAPSSDRAPPEA